MISLLLLLILVCMVGHAFFAGIETGVISIHRMRLRHFVRQGSINARILESFVTNFDRLLGTTLVGTNICVVIISVVAASLAIRLEIPGGEAASSVVMTILVIVFAEYLPKAWFHSRPLERCERFAGVLRVAEWILLPISFAIIAMARLLSPGDRKSFTKPDPFVTREDLKLLAREGEKDGVLSSKERYMIHRVIEMSVKKAADVMVPRDKMVAAYGDMKIPEFYELARKSGLTRMPVLDRETGEFTGIINVFFLLWGNQNHSQKTIAEFVRPPQFIPATMPVDDILPRMRRGRQPMILVKQGEVVTGLITTEDILRTIVGKL
jgi:putative hemolysin